MTGAPPRQPTGLPLSERLRHRLERRLLGLWFNRQPPAIDRLLVGALAPLSALTAREARRRRSERLKRPERGLPPIVVVGNLLVGGTGKTPAVAAIATGLRDRGLRVGLLTGAYRAANAGPNSVQADSDAAQVGDEALLLARLCRLPVVSGRDRRQALERLLATHAELDVVVCDDGLQHFGLPRTVELAVFDHRGAGNGRTLPAGPLREPLAAALGMDALLLNGVDTAPVDHPVRFRYDVVPIGLRPLAPRAEAGQSLSPSTATDGLLTADQFRRVAGDQPILAVAGIADPERFFGTLSRLGLSFQRCPLPDHARLDATWFAAVTQPLIVMTDKDAVKLPREVYGLSDGPDNQRRLEPGDTRGGDPRVWILQVAARFDPAFFDWLLDRLRK